MQNDFLYDVAVIGGGLAGLSLAIQCAQHNFKVVLFEKEIYPFHKVCGEYISMESWRFLQSLGVELESADIPLINKLQLSDVNGNIYSFKLPLGGFGISRYSLDFQLYKIALSKGVIIHTDSKVREVVFNNELFTISSGKVQVRAKIAAGCYGKRSNLDIAWKRPFTTQKTNSLHNYIGIKYHVLSSVNSDSIALHNFHNGYCGISAIEEGKSCLCYLTTAQNLKECGNSIKSLEDRILFQNPQLKKIFNTVEFLYDQPLAISKINFDKKSQVQNHVLMVGDSAGMITPLCGNGMSMAMHAAKIAFECIARFLNTETSRDKMENNYKNQWNKIFAKRLWIGRNVQKLLGGNRSTSLFIKTMHAVPSLAKLLIRSTHGTPF